MFANLCLIHRCKKINTQLRLILVKKQIKNLIKFSYPVQYWSCCEVVIKPYKQRVARSILQCSSVYNETSVGGLPFCLFSPPLLNTHGLTRCMEHAYLNCYKFYLLIYLPIKVFWYLTSWDNVAVPKYRLLLKDLVRGENHFLKHIALILWRTRHLAPLKHRSNTWNWSHA